MTSSFVNDLLLKMFICYMWLCIILDNFNAYKIILEKVLNFAAYIGPYTNDETDCEKIKDISFESRNNTCKFEDIVTNDDNNDEIPELFIGLKFLWFGKAKFLRK